MKGRPYTREEDEIIISMYPEHYAKEIAPLLGRTLSSVYQRAKHLGVESSEGKIQRSGRESSQNPNVIKTQFKKGRVSHNKGQKMPPEVYEKVKATMFKKGNLPANHRKVGSERVNVDGYIEVKVAEPNKWRLKHRIVWEEHNGPIPKGYNIQFKNRISTDCRIENLYILSRAEQMRTENGITARYPEELRKVIQLKGALKRAIKRRDNEE